MFPPGHAVAGYVAFSLVQRARDDVPTGPSAAWVLLGTQLPDLIDKPLAWWFGILPSGRSLAHSVLFAVPLVVVVGVWLRRRDRPVDAVGFAVGYVSHLATDSLPLLPHEPEWVAFLVWPLLALPEPGPRPALWPPQVLIDPVELVFGTVGVAIWVADGAPGLEYARAVYDRLTGA